MSPVAHGLNICDSPIKRKRSWSQFDNIFIHISTPPRVKPVDNLGSHQVLPIPHIGLGQAVAEGVQKIFNEL